MLEAAPWAGAGTLERSCQHESALMSVRSWSFHSSEFSFTRVVQAIRQAVSSRPLRQGLGLLSDRWSLMCPALPRSGAPQPGAWVSQGPQQQATRRAPPGASPDPPEANHPGSAWFAAGCCRSHVRLYSASPPAGRSTRPAHCTGPVASLERRILRTPVSLMRRRPRSAKPIADCRLMGIRRRWLKPSRLTARIYRTGRPEGRGRRIVTPSPRHTGSVDRSLRRGTALNGSASCRRSGCVVWLLSWTRRCFAAGCRWPRPSSGRMSVEIFRTRALL